MNPSVDLEILADDVYVAIDGKTVHPPPGTIIPVRDPSIVGALTKFGKARLAGAGHGGHPRPAAATAPEPDGGPARLRWQDIPGISETSLQLLVKRAPDEDPASVTHERLTEILGSAQRSGFVHRAIQDYLNPPEDTGADDSAGDRP